MPLAGTPGSPQLITAKEKEAFLADHPLSHTSEICNKYKSDGSECFNAGCNPLIMENEAFVAQKMWRAALAMEQAGLQHREKTVSTQWSKQWS